MRQKIYLIFLLPMLFLLASCSKEEIIVPVLQDSYEPKPKEPEFTGEEFSVSLNATALQDGERGEWKIISGPVVENFVYLENARHPFTKFKGMPGETYVLEWTQFTREKTARTVKSTVTIPPLNIEIIESTPAQFQTIRIFEVDLKYRGTWSFEGNYGYLNSRYHDGHAEPAERKPVIELHGFAYTTYKATFTFNYGGKDFKFHKTVTTGDYTQDEGLYELQLPRGSHRVIEDNAGNVIELNLQAAGIAWILGEPTTYPALNAFKKLRKLILGGSSLSQIPVIAGDSYLELEELSMDMMGSIPVFPENIGNLSKLKKLDFRPMNMVDPNNEVLLPKSFGNLKSLEYLSVSWAGFVNFNGTLGKLTKLKKLEVNILSLPEDIGNLRDLRHMELYSVSPVVPESLSDCTSLTFMRLRFYESGSGEVTLPVNIGKLKNLDTLYLSSRKLRTLPESMSSLPALRALYIEDTNLESIPQNFGNFPNLQTLLLYGKFTSIPESFGKLSKLSILMLSGHAPALPESFGNLSSLTYFNAESSELKSLPNSFGNLKKLKELTLAGTKIESLPSSFSELDALENLNLSTTLLKTFPRNIIPLKNIHTVNLNNTGAGDIPDEITEMRSPVIFTTYGITNLTMDHLNHILRISKGKYFYTNFGYFSSLNSD